MISDTAQESDHHCDPYYLVYPPEPSSGALGAFARESRLYEIRALEQEAVVRSWEVRAYISDYIPLAGAPSSAFERPAISQIRVNENPLWIYLHRGGRSAVYYGLHGDDSGKLTYITVNVESQLPSNALLLARQPINALLDVFTRDSNMPLLIQRLDLLSPKDGQVLVSEALIPERQGVVIGPLGGIRQAIPFAPYDALYREALTSTSPFYRLLCAWKMYEGTNKIRRWIREELERRQVSDRMPPDPEVNQQELVAMGLDPQFVQGVRKAGDLFNKLADARDAIAHFLIERDGGESHIYLADGAQLHTYAAGSAVLLRYAHRILEDLRLFCVGRVNLGGGGAAILPTPEDRDQFRVRASDFGLR